MHGSLVGKTNVPSCGTHLPKLSDSLKLTPSTPKQQSDLSLMNRIALNFSIQNGKTSSQDERLTSTQCSVDSYPLPMMIPRSKSLEISKSLSEQSNLPKWSKTGENGRSLGIEQSEPSSLPFPTEFKNSQSMENISLTCSQSLIPAYTAESSHLTEPSGRELGASGTLNYPTSRNLPISRSRTWIRSGFQLSRGLLRKKVDVKGRKERTGKETNHVTNGMTTNAVKRKRIVEDYMSATSVERADTEERSVESEQVPKRPKYLQRSVWTDTNASPAFSPTAGCTLTEKALPRPPPEEFLNSDAMNTIRNNPHLFKIITPINVERFEEMLEPHPNKPFVQSICTSLREGFWPWANTQKEEYPTTWDFSDRPPKTESEAAFLREQRDVKISAGRYSQILGLTYYLACTALQSMLFQNRDPKS